MKKKSYHKYRKHTKYAKRRKKEIYKRRQKHQNAGQILEDAVYHYIQYRQQFFNRFYNSVAENVKYVDYAGTTREVDVFAIHHVTGKKRYVILFECKLTNRRTKAIDQLRRSRNYVLSMYPDARVFCFYAYNYRFDTGKYTIKWLRRV